ncbi:MAG TPA: ChbG/HpnK family deacetylase [Gemmatimonadales bacterium]|nr:ChbG/HpnK family deacetylase [Gemmatimonadales bacterium]
MNADDFGFSAGVNRGILEVAAAGVVTSVSVLVNAPGWEDGLDRLAAWPELGVGLHLNLTVGEPVGRREGGGGGGGGPSSGRTLVDARTGRFHSLAGLVARALAGRIDPDEVAAECAAQLARLRAARPTVTHLDSHRHVHVLPGVWRAVVATARSHGVDVVRRPLEPVAAAPVNWRALAKRAALAAAWRVAARGVASPRHADRFVGISLQGRRGFLEAVLALLDRLQPGTTELMVHPGHPDGTLAEWDDYVAPRAAELTALTSDAVRERCRRGDFRLTHFGALA